MTEVKSSWEDGSPVWWSTVDGRWSGTVLRHRDDGYLVTLHDHPTWRWVEQVPAVQLTERHETPELVVVREHGMTMTTWTCPHPAHALGNIISYSSNVTLARRDCARYMPPFGHAHNERLPAHLLPDGVTPDSMPVWFGGIAPPS